MYGIYTKGDNLFSFYIDVYDFIRHSVPPVVGRDSVDTCEWSGYRGREIGMFNFIIWIVVASDGDG